jgi:hypothetical protein
VPKRPATITIYNTTVNTNNWTAIAGVTLSGVLSWKLREKDGQGFDYAFVAVPVTYMTSLGESIIRDIEITEVYVRKTVAGTANLAMQLEVAS